jgi:hypothetical protein
LCDFLNTGADDLGKYGEIAFFLTVSSSLQFSVFMETWVMVYLLLRGDPSMANYCLEDF